jgi:cap1 methyltransferase
MIEMINTFDFLNDRNPIQSFHLAEGPGGFIEAFNYKRKNPADVYYGMTLINDNSNIPSWKKASHILNSNKNIKLEYGASKNGDLFLKENLLYCNKKYAKCMDYITGDGGFDFSSDFNNQEDISFKLILSQVFYALIMQKKGGHFVLKIFDVFKIKTVEVIYLLCNLYENVFIFKPNTSRSANSEKYIICRNYKNNNKRIISNIIENFDILINQVESIHSLFNIHFNQLFITKLQEINAIYGQQQLENIKNTLGLIRELKMLNIEYNLLNFIL